MAVHHLPIPPELADPSPDDSWVDSMVEACVHLAGLLGMDAGAVAGELATEEGPDADEMRSEAMPAHARNWAITDTGSAEWAMRHVAAAEAAMAQDEAQADEWKRKIDAWYATRTAKLVATQAFFAGHLERYALALREANPKSKTLTLPSGKVQTSYVGARVEIADPDMVVEWLESAGHADAVKVTKKPLVSELRDHVWPVAVGGEYRAVDDDGEVVPGVYVAPEHVTAKTKADR